MRADETSPFIFDHERLDAYRLALEWLAISEEIAKNLPKGRGQLADQLRRASAGIPLTTPAGLPRRGADRARFYCLRQGEHGRMRLDPGCDRDMQAGRRRRTDTPGSRPAPSLGTSLGWPRASGEEPIIARLVGVGAGSRGARSPAVAAPGSSWPSCRSGSANRGTFAAMRTRAR